MKKLAFMFVAVVAMSFASCGGNKAEQPVEEATDSVAVDTVATDSAAADSVVADSAATDSVVAE